MKKQLIAILLLFALTLTISGCSNTAESSNFKITFIDVGQGDSALVECDNHFMLIDGGDTDAADAVKCVLKDNNVSQLDVLVASHLHEDHIGGLINGLDNVKKVKHTLSNSKKYNSDSFDAFNKRVHALGSRIKVPKVNSTYNLGSAEVKVIDVRDEKNNDSLVLLITYGKTTFLFAGDMEQNQENRICERFGDDDAWNINLLKVAHHGSKTSTSIRFLRMLMPQYAVISVAPNRTPQHPSEQTLSRLDQANVETYQTAVCGNITVVSNGENLEITSEK